MALMSWSPQLLIGHETIDSEHQELFRIINEFHDLWLKKPDPQEIANVLDLLVNYAQEHFHHEEAIMQHYGYPQLCDHQFIHEIMVDALFDLRKSLQNQETTLESEIMNFARSWLVDHIANHDFLFRNFLSRKKATVA